MERGPAHRLIEVTVKRSIEDKANGRVRTSYFWRAVIGALLCTMSPNKVST